MVTPPAYLGIPERTVDLNTGVVSAVEGSKVRIELDMPTARSPPASFGPTRGLSVEERQRPPAYAPLSTASWKFPA